MGARGRPVRHRVPVSYTHLDVYKRQVDTYEMDAMNSPAAQNFGDFAYYDEDGNLTKYNYCLLYTSTLPRLPTLPHGRPRAH